MIGAAHPASRKKCFAGKSNYFFQLNSGRSRRSWKKAVGCFLPDELIGLMLTAASGLFRHFHITWREIRFPKIPRQKASMFFYLAAHSTMSALAGKHYACCYALPAPEAGNHAFSKDFQGFPINVRFRTRREIHFQAYTILRLGAIGKHKEFQRFQLNPSVIPRRALGIFLGCCYALPALKARNHAFSIDFQCFPITVRFDGFPGRRPQPHFAEKAWIPNVFAYVFFLGRNVFSWQVVLNPLEM